VANLLKKLELDELSLVDRPANTQAKVSLFKRDNPNVPTEELQTKEDEMKISEEMKALMKPYMDKGMSEEEAMKAYADDMKKLKEDKGRMMKALEDNGFVITEETIEKAAPVEMIEVEGVSVVKSDVPAPVLKALEKAEQERAEAAIAKRAEADLPNFALDVAKELLKSFGDNEAVLIALKSADAAIKSLTTEHGETGEAEDLAKASDKLDAMVKEYMKANNMAKGDYAKAYAAVANTDEGRALINKSYEEK
jgi:hypothetical protein